MRKLSIGKIKGIFFLVVMVFGMATVRGEDNASSKEKIMEIKLNEDFIFGEGVSDDKDIAYGIAMEDLLIFANELKDRNSQEKLSISDLLTKVESLVYESGARYEVVVYIPLKIVIETERKDPSARSGIVINRPGFEIADDEPEIEEEEIFIADNPTGEAPSVEEIVEEVAVEEVKKEEEPLVAEAQPTMAVETPALELPQPIISYDTTGEVEDFLLTQDNFAEIKSFLSEMKRKGKIVETGASETIVGLPKDASLILIDELGGILALLSPVSPGERINYRTHKSDSETNYNSKFIVWYKK